jgi:F5/8 type C domain
MELRTVVLIVFVLIIISVLATPSSKSVVPTTDEVAPAITQAAAGNVELLRKAKYVELKKIENVVGASGGTINVGNIMLYPKGASQPLPASALTATASSVYDPKYPASQVINYAIPSSFWHSKHPTAQAGEWVRVELTEPTVLDHITVLNRADDPNVPVIALRMIGVQVTVLDTDSKPIKTYVISEKAPAYTFAAS